MKHSSLVRQIVITAAETPTEPLEICMPGTETHVEIRLEEGAKAVIFDTSTSTTHAVSVTLAARSELLYVSLSTDSTRRFVSTIGEGASLHWHCTTIGSAAGGHSLVSTCAGPNATSNIDWIFASQSTEKQAVTVRNVFAARNGGGEITLKGVAQQKAHAVCSGMIEITEQGTGTDTYLTEDVLMLDSTAKVDAIPGLEIRTNDVKASHSATVSRVTAEDLFYFQSRGIDALTARSIFVDGFLSDLTDRIPQANIRDRVLSALGLVSHRSGTE